MFVTSSPLSLQEAFPKLSRVLQTWPLLFFFLGFLVCTASFATGEPSLPFSKISLYLTMQEDLHDTEVSFQEAVAPQRWHISLLAPPSPTPMLSSPPASLSLLRDRLPPKIFTSILSRETPQGVVTLTASFLPDRDLAALHASQLFDTSPVDFADPDLRLLYATTLSVLPILAWAATLDADADAALHFSPRRFAAPFFASRFEDTSPFALDRPRTDRMVQRLAIAQLHRTAADTFQYDIYAGIATNDQSQTLLTGARIGYAFGNDVWAFGILYGYGLPERRSLFAERVQAADPAENTYRIIGFDVLYDNGRFSLEQRIAYGVYSDETRRFTFFSQPAVRLTQHWTVFYRLDHLSLGHGMPKSTDHVMGMKLTPFTRLLVRAEWSVHNADSASEDGWGFRLLGTLRF